ncbi:class I SAM-dependent methyltransferase [Fibrella arboris]|uniref:class I SAM-dependent methyltransferase n=1 Tax=Fibrella arboris TaxID=3242486 RepID=UPI003520C6A4
MPATICPICENSQPKASKRLEGYQQGVFFDVLFCPGCDTAYVADRTSHDKIYDLIYANADVVGGYCRYQQFHDQIKKQARPLQYLAEQEGIYWTILKSIQDQLIVQTDRILEVGCGLGYLTYALRQEGYLATGIDISPEAISNATACYGPYYRAENIIGLSGRSQERYDVIIMTELIEHLEDPLLFLSEVRQLLAPNGKLLITTPNKSFLHKNRETWQSDLPPVHFWWFSEQSVQPIARRLNMQYQLLDFSDYNRKTGNYALVINDALQPRVPTFDPTGNVLNPVEKPGVLMRFMLQALRVVKRGLLPFLNRDTRQSQTLAFILTNDAVR